MIKNKKLSLLLTTVFLLGVIFITSSAVGAVDLRIAWWGSQNRHERTLEVIEMFEERNPDVNIEAEYLGWNGYWDRLAGQSAAGNLPDIIQQDYQYLAQYVGNDRLVNLSPYIEEGVLDFTNVVDSAVAGGKIDGELYGLNLGSNSLVQMYNPEMFEEAGVEEPTADWTWEDYMEIARKLHAELGVYGDSSFPQSMSHHGLHHYLRQHGKSFYHEDGTKLGYEDDDLFIEFFEMDYQLTQEGVIPGAAERAENIALEDKMFGRREAAMDGTIHSNQVVAFASSTDVKPKLITFPKAKDQVQEGHYLKPSQFFSVTKDSENPEMAVKFLDFFTNSIEANKVLRGERGVPISTEVRDALVPLLDETQAASFEYIGLVQENSSPIGSPEPEGHSQVLDTLESLHERILFDAISVEEAAEEFRSRANSILSRNK